MAIYKNTPPIVTNGLVLHLDAGSRQSYVSGSTTWTDLSGNNNTGTLTNGPTFNTANQGSIVFDGVNDYISGIPNPSITNQMTISTWCNLDSSNVTGIYVASAITGRESLYRLIYAPPTINWVIATTNNAWYSAGTIISASISNNTWTNVAAVYNGSTVLLYMNGVLQATGGSVTGNIISGVTAFSIMGNVISNITYGKGLISSYSLYNRGLNAQEVAQNYNALKSRFGLT